MSSADGPQEPIELPDLPAPHDRFIQHLASNPNVPIQELLEPYKIYDNKLREVFAQQPDHAAIKEPNVVPIFKSHSQSNGSDAEHLRIRARDLAAESEQEQARYLIQLDAKDRRADGSPAVVQTLQDFRTNFAIFSESALSDMDWSNVAVAGSAVVTSLLPVPEQYSGSKRALREYYHDKLAPASDVDLFLYDLTEEQAVKKIKQIETCIRDSILSETTTIRTKNAITIASQHPIRHIQIVLRLYRSMSEILTGFDVDCSCAAYDGKQVYASPRAIGAYMTQINTVDLSRRSPSYENRLSKYSHRGFEIYWPLLDRKRIDPTIFERSFGRTLGLARLLVLEKLPTATDRDSYNDKRRQERGRPAVNRYMRDRHKVSNNIKDEHEDETPDWVHDDELSNYHTFTVPYGPRITARKIERLLYAKDLLLNAEWNRPKDRNTDLHRHPAFFGSADDVIGDCCGYCPVPTTTEDKELAEEESKIYVSGEISFLTDDPGRQAIGSFHPITDNDWTEMAYIGNTAALCQAIANRDLEQVEDWLQQDGADPNERDYTGRTPLQLAVQCSSTEIVQCLVDHDARMVARMADGRTALHIAAMMGNVCMIKILLRRSEVNEEEEAEKEAVRAKSRAISNAETGESKKVKADAESTSATPDKDDDDEEDEDDQDDFEKVDNAEEDKDDDEDENDDEHEAEDEEDDEDSNEDATTDRSYVKITSRTEQQTNDLELASTDEPDVFDVNVLAWDTPVSPLHLAIANGHLEAVKILVQEFAADVLLPVKTLKEFDRSVNDVILTIVIAMDLPSEKAGTMIKLLVSLGATIAQATIDQVTAMQYLITKPPLLRIALDSDEAGASRAINHLTVWGNDYSPQLATPLKTAIHCRDPATVRLLLDMGAKPEIEYEQFLQSMKYRSKQWSIEKPRPGYNNAHNLDKDHFARSAHQPILQAAEFEMPSVVIELLDAGADVNTLNSKALNLITSHHMFSHEPASSLLDIVAKRRDELKEYKMEQLDWESPLPLDDDFEYLAQAKPGTYQYWMIRKQLQSAKKNYKDQKQNYKERKESWDSASKGRQVKYDTVQALADEFAELAEEITKRGGKTFKELHPDVEDRNHGFWNRQPYKAAKQRPWQPSLEFRGTDPTYEVRMAYIELFEASWSNDLATIKRLTLGVRDGNKSPLKIAVLDSEGFNPYSIAICRGHLELSKAILEIVHAQFSPPEGTGRTRYSLRPFGDNNDDEGRAAYVDDEGVQIYSEIVDDQYTIENIGELQTQVQSDTKPIDLLTMSIYASCFLEEDDLSISESLTSGFSYGQQSSIPLVSKSDTALSPKRTQPRLIEPEVVDTDTLPLSLIQFAIYKDDKELLTVLLDQAEEYTRLSAKEDEEDRLFFDLPDADLLYAIKLGRIEMLSNMIKRTGAGIPLNDLVKDSGVEEVQKKPKYYQGLSVHGKKRADWAQPGGGANMASGAQKHPPLLHAAKDGSMSSVHWFLSDAPMQAYSEFAEKNKEDERLKTLARSKEGLHAAIANFLDANQKLLLHCVILGKTSDTSLKLLDYIIESRPELIEVKSSNGFTPLHLAFHLHRIEMAKRLIAAGADQTCRNFEGSNLVHTAVVHWNGQDDSDSNDLRESLGLIDPRLLESLFTERCSVDPGSLTPYALWMYRFAGGSLRNQEHQVTYFNTVLEFSKGVDLDMISGTGDTPMHVAVKHNNYLLVEAILKARPELLGRENAIGKTPIEAARDSVLHGFFSGPPEAPCLPYSDRRQVIDMSRDHHYPKAVDKQAEDYVSPPTHETQWNALMKTWEVCEAVARRSSADAEGEASATKRKLVSLMEANEVARRLAASQIAVAGGRVPETRKQEDEVDAWLYVAERQE